MINIAKLFDYKSNRILFINKLLKLQSHSYVVKLNGNVDLNKIRLFIYNTYCRHNIDCKLAFSDFMFNQNKGYIYLEITKLYYCGKLVTNVIFTTSKEYDECLDIDVNELYNENKEVQ